MTTPNVARPEEKGSNYDAPATKADEQRTDQPISEAFSKKQRPRSRTLSDHHKQVWLMSLSAAGVPLHIRNYPLAILLTADEVDEDGVLRITDMRLADATSCGGLNPHFVSLREMTRRIRDERRDFEEWQEASGVILIDRQLEYLPGQKKNFSIYPKIPLYDLIAKVNKTCGPSTPKKKLKDTIRSVFLEYQAEQVKDDIKWERPKRPGHTPESELNRAWALVEKAVGQVAMVKGENAAIGFLAQSLRPKRKKNAKKGGVDTERISAILAGALSANSFFNSNLTLPGCDNIRNTFDDDLGDDFDTDSTAETEPEPSAPDSNLKTVRVDSQGEKTITLRPKKPADTFLTENKSVTNGLPPPPRPTNRRVHCRSLCRRVSNGVRRIWAGRGLPCRDFTDCGQRPRQPGTTPPPSRSASR